MNSIWKILVSSSLCVTLVTNVFAYEVEPGGRGYMGKRMGPNNTFGWANMTKQERIEHQDKIRSMQNYDECKSYIEQHHDLMVERAKEMGRSMPIKPRSNVCVPLKK